MESSKKGNDVVVLRGINKSIDLFICSDVHYDSLKCDRESFKVHLDQIKEKNGKVVIVGDLFDVMGCYRDPRSKFADIDPKYIVRGRSYLDLVLEDVYEFLKPYRDNILLISYGNHETAILKHRDTDIVDRLVYMLNQDSTFETQKGAYAGWLMLIIYQSHSSAKRCSFRIAYHHGKGGNAKRSKGILYSQMDAMEYPDANMIVSGHDHNKLYDPSNVRRRLNWNKSIFTYKDSVHWLKTGSYKKSSDDFGWEVEKGFTPKRLGGWFVNLTASVVEMRDEDRRISKSVITPTVTEAVPVNF
jgi:UDP-2,3-diacylglucosamine pyrophosphatase LpxH